MGATTYLYASVRAPDAQWVPLTGGHVASALLVAALRNSRYSFHFSLGPSFVVEPARVDRNAGATHKDFSLPVCVVAPGKKVFTNLGRGKP